MRSSVGVSWVNSRTMVEDGLKGSMCSKVPLPLSERAIWDKSFSLVKSITYLGCSEPAVPSRVFSADDCPTVVGTWSQEST